MVLPAVISGEFQFCAGPETHRFYACTRHMAEFLRRDSPTDLFWRVPCDQDRDKDVDDGYECDWCRGEDGP